MSNLKIHENVPLAPYTTLGIGGPARFLIKAATEEQVWDALNFARSRSCPVFVLGGGSNILVADTGFPGLVIKIETRGIQSLDHEGRILAAAGEIWDDFVRYCVDRELAGLECLSGIPGTVGGAPIQNIGAYGAEVGNSVMWVRVLDRQGDYTTELSNAECKFDYRSSIFNTDCPDRFIVLSVAFALRPNGRPSILHPELQSRFGSQDREPSLQKVRRAVIQIRKAKAMVLCENDPDTKSVGSFFKNPLVHPREADRIQNQLRARGLLADSETMPCFWVALDKVKLSAAWLVERAGFQKGYVFGNAGISSKHCLALINRGGASAQEIIDLMRLIQSKVYDLFGVELHPEPTLVGIRYSM